MEREEEEEEGEKRKKEGSRVRVLIHGNIVSPFDLLQEKGQRERCMNPYWTTIQETNSRDLYNP